MQCDSQKKGAKFLDVGLIAAIYTLSILDITFGNLIMGQKSYMLSIY